MPIEISLLTKDDLTLFKADLIREITGIIQPQTTQKKFVRVKEARAMLGNVSIGTMSNLRVKGTLTPTRLPGSKIDYYSVLEIENLLGQKIIKKA